MNFDPVEKLVQEDGEGANDNDYWSEQRADLYRNPIPSMFDSGEEILWENIEAFQAIVSESSCLIPMLPAILLISG
jgi:hypothetical protein